jgi:hypothetical protein
MLEDGKWRFVTVKFFTSTFNFNFVKNKINW